MVDDIVRNDQFFGAFIQKHAIAFCAAGINGHIMNEVTGDATSWLTAQAVNTPTITEYPHDVVNVIVQNGILKAGRRDGIPHPADGNAGIGQLTYFIGIDGRAGNQAAPDTHGAIKNRSAIINPAMGDAVIRTDLLGYRLPPGLSFHLTILAFTDVDAISGYIFDRAIHQLIIVTVFADADSGSSQMPEGTIPEDRLPGFFQLYRSRNGTPSGRLR